MEMDRALKRRLLHYVVLETLFLGVTLWFYRDYLYLFSMQGPLPVGYYMIYFAGSGIPTTDKAIFSLVSIVLRLNIYQSQLISNIIQLNLLLFSSYFLIKCIIDIIYKLPLTHSHQFLVIVATIFFSVNPFFLFIDYKFGISWISFINISLTLLLYLIEKNLSIIKFLGVELISVFFLTLAVNEYPLVYVFYPSIYILSVLPLAWIISKVKKAVIGFIVNMFLLIFFSNFFSLFNLVFVPDNPPSLPIEHPFNLVFINLVDQIPSVLIGELGIDGFSTPSGQILMYYIIILAIMISLMLIVIITANNKKIRTIMPLIFVILVGLDLPIINDLSLPVLFLVELMGNHVVTSIRLGLIFTVLDANRLQLYLYWYELLILLSLSIATLSSYFSMSLKHKIFDIKGKTFILLLSLTLIAGIVLAPLSNYPPGFTIPATTKAYGFNSFNYIYSYINSEKNINYNQWIYLPTATGYSPSIIFPNVMSSDTPFYPFYLNVQEVTETPYFKQLFETLPAGTYIYQTEDTPAFMTPIKINQNLSYSQNFNATNIILGYPIFVVGSETSFDNFLFSNAFLSDNSVTTYEGSQNSTLQYFPIPSNYLMELNTTSGVLAISIHVKLKAGNETRSYLFGITNGTLQGFGAYNNFYGMTLSNNSIIVPFYNFNNVWNGFSYEENGNPNSFTIYIFIYKDINYLTLYESVNNFWTNLNTSFRFDHFKFISFQAYDANPKYVSFNVSVTFLKPRTFNFIPVFYDSYFSNINNLINALNHSYGILIGKDYTFTDLVDTMLYWSGDAKVIYPAAYAINEPKQGWYQTFNSNDPQAAYYSECIPSWDLPLQFGYGSYVGYANSVYPNQTLTIPLPLDHNKGQYQIALNILFSPLGGKLELLAGSEKNVISTFSPEPYYRWINFSLPNVSNIKIINMGGVQSVNLILLYTNKQFQIYFQKLHNTLTDKPVLSENNILNETSLSEDSVDGIFNAVVESATLTIHLTNVSNTNLVLEIPCEINYNYIIYSQQSHGFIEPVWGYYIGIVIYSYTGNIITLRLSLPIQDYYSGVTTYIPLLIGIGFLFLARKRFN